MGLNQDTNGYSTDHSGRHSEQTGLNSVSDINLKVQIVPLNSQVILVNMVRMS